MLFSVVRADNGRYSRKSSKPNKVLKETMIEQLFCPNFFTPINKAGEGLTLRKPRNIEYDEYDSDGIFMAVKAQQECFMRVCLLTNVPRKH